MDKSTTKRLEEILLNIENEEELKEYVEDDTSMSAYKDVAEYLNERLLEKEETTSDIIQKSGIERTYAYQILNGTRNPSKDKIVRLCIAAECSPKETIRALEIANEGTLYSRNRRDAIILYSIQNGCTVDETNILLNQFNEEILG